MIPILITLSAIAAPKPIETRLATLTFHLERLEAIEVEDEFRREKEERSLRFRTMLETGVETDGEVDGIYREMDRFRDWLLARAKDRPRLPEGTFEETSDYWTVRTPGLAVRIHRHDLSIVFETAEARWETETGSEQEAVLRDGTAFALGSARRKTAEGIKTGFASGALITLSHFAEAEGLVLNVNLSITGTEATFDLVAVRDIGHLERIEWPRPIRTEAVSTDVAVLNRMQGILVPGDLDQEFRWEELCESRTLYMPWWGHLRGARGIQAIFETPHDAGARYDHPAGGPTVVQPIWYSSLNRLGYPRIVRYVLDDAATYVSMARRYRRYVQEKGDFVSLEEKRVRTPRLNEVIGRPVVHIGALYHTVEGSRFYREQNMEGNHRLQTFDEIARSLASLHEAGIESAYVHLDGWGYRGYDNVHPDVVPAGPEQGGAEAMRRLADLCDELGYLLAVHDQYRDYYYGAVSFDERLAVQNWDGGYSEHAEWAGGLQTFLSPRFAPGYVRRNHDWFVEQGIRVKGAYLDVFAVVPLEESFQDAHPVTRRDCAEYRRDCLDLLRARGYVVSSEEPADYLTRSMDLVHHGPYPTHPKGYGPGDPLGIPVPLFNLVYHDSLLMPWYLGDDGGWGIPNGDSATLHCFLNTGLPYVGPGSPPERIALVKEAAAVAGRLGTLDMVNHEFLDASRRVQRTTFSDGSTVTVDFAKKTYSVE